MRMKAKLAGLLAACLLLTGCAGAGAQSANREPAVVPFTCIANPKGNEKIYVILKSYHGSYWEDVIRGVCDAAAETDKAVYLGGIDNEVDIQAQKELMEEALFKGADGILLAPADSTALVENCVRARGKDIPVVLLDSAVNTGDFDACFMTDNMAAGKMAAREMLRLLDEKYAHVQNLKIAIQLSSDVSQGMVNRVSGFLEWWSDNAPEGWTVAEDILLNGGDLDTAQVNTRQLLKDHPDLKGFFTCNNTSTMGVAKTLLEDGRNDIVMVGFDLADVTKELVGKPGFSAETLLQHQYQMGKLGLETLDGLLRGEKPGQKYFDTGVTVAGAGALIQGEAA